MKASSGGPAGGWKTLGIWVALAFAVLILSWVALIKVASKFAPEPVPLEESK